MFLKLVESLALLLALCYLYGFGIRLWHRRPLARQIFCGLLFGGICMVGMHVPLVLEPGVIIDARSIVLSMAALFGGPLVAGIAAAMAAVTRLSLGGAGTQTSVQVIVLCTALGLAFHQARSRGLLKVTPLNLAAFGLLLHLAVLALLQQLPEAIVRQLTSSPTSRRWLGALQSSKEGDSYRVQACA